MDVSAPFAAKLFGSFAVLVGFVLGVLYAGVGLVLDARAGALGGGTALAFLALVGMPLMLLPVGVVGGVVWAWAYRHLAARFGGWSGRFDVVDD